MKYLYSEDTKSLDEVKNILKGEIGKQHESVFLDYLSLLSDYGVTVSYVALFFPQIYFINKVPYSNFGDENNPLPLDCFHVDLLHHSGAKHQKEIFFSIIGKSLAYSWSTVLKVNNLPGHFIYNDISNYDVVYINESI